MIPNAITAMALCLGLTGVRFAVSASHGEVEHWQLALACVVGAGILDGMDGRIARLLRAQSKFGAELDSLSDTIAFGTAPALILFLWSLQYAPKFGWTAALALAVCCALRLARFNARLDAAEQPHKSAGFNTGVPAPAGAGLVAHHGRSAVQGLAARDGLDPVHCRTDDLEPSNLQLVLDPNSARVAPVHLGGRGRSGGSAAHSDLVHAPWDRDPLFAHDPGRGGELRPGQAAARQRAFARIGF
jgi:CDP-diacylglycerol--serine O-phosphatidyltransferase